MKYEEFIARMDGLNHRIIDIEIEKTQLAEEFIQELEFQSGDYVSFDNNIYEVCSIGYNFDDEYFFADVMAVEVNGGPCPEDPDHWEFRPIITICGEDVLQMKLIKSGRQKTSNNGTVQED